MTTAARFQLRPARPDEFDFAAEIHIAAMRPLMQALDAWDEPMRRAAIRRSFKAADARIISRDGADIGWTQITPRDADYHLAQIQILESHCGLGIGSEILQALLAQAGREGRTVSLSVVRGNRAIGLYLRLGFRFIDPEASPILDMVWTPAPQ